MNRIERKEEEKIKIRKLNFKLRKIFIVFMIMNMMLSLYVIKIRSDSKLGIESQLQQNIEAIISKMENINLDIHNIEFRNILENIKYISYE